MLQKHNNLALLK